MSPLYADPPTIRGRVGSGAQDSKPIQQESEIALSPGLLFLWYTCERGSRLPAREWE